MSEEKDLEYYSKLEYRISVVRKNGFYEAGIPELGIMKKGPKLQDAFDELEKAKQELLKNYVESGYQSWIPLPETGTQVVHGTKTTVKTAEAFSWWTVLRPLLVSGIFVAVLAIGAAGIVNKVGPKAGKMVAKFEMKFKKLETKFKSLGDLPDEKVELYQLRARKICARIKPITDEIKVLWEEKK